MEKELEKALEIIRKEAFATLIANGEKDRNWDLKVEKKLEGGAKLSIYTDIVTLSSTPVYVSINYTPTNEERVAMRKRAADNADADKEKRRAELLAELAKLDEKEGEE